MRNCRLENISDIPIKVDSFAPLGRVGMLKLATDFSSEQDIGCMLPEGMDIYSNRINSDPAVTIDNLQNMYKDIRRAMADLLPGFGVDAVIFGCTSGALAIGEGRLKAQINDVLPNIPVANPAAAARAAFVALGALRISILTPYIDSVNTMVATHFVERGYKVQSLAGFGLKNDIDIQHVSADTIYDAALRVCHKESDLLFISCTGLRTSGVIDRIENALGKPVVTSNQALAWFVSRLLNHQKPVHGFGSLFDKTLQC